MIWSKAPRMRAIVARRIAAIALAVLIANLALVPSGEAGWPVGVDSQEEGVEPGLNFFGAARQNSRILDTVSTVLDSGEFVVAGAYDLLESEVSGAVIDEFALGQFKGTKGLFVARFNAGGDLVWVQNAPLLDSQFSSHLNVQAIAADNSRVYIGGVLAKGERAQFGAATLVNNDPDLGQGPSAFVASMTFESGAWLRSRLDPGAVYIAEQFAAANLEIFTEKYENSYGQAIAVGPNELLHLVSHHKNLSGETTNLHSVLDVHTLRSIRTNQISSNNTTNRNTYESVVKSVVIVETARFPTGAERERLDAYYLFDLQSAADSERNFIDGYCVSKCAGERVDLPSMTFGGDPRPPIRASDGLFVSKMRWFDDGVDADPVLDWVFRVHDHQALGTGRASRLYGKGLAVDPSGGVWIAGVRRPGSSGDDIKLIYQGWDGEPVPGPSTAASGGIALGEVNTYGPTSEVFAIGLDSTGRFRTAKGFADTSLPYDQAESLASIVEAKNDFELLPSGMTAIAVDENKTIALAYPERAPNSNDPYVSDFHVSLWRDETNSFPDLRSSYIRPQSEAANVPLAFSLLAHPQGGFLFSGFVFHYSVFDAIRFVDREETLYNLPSLPDPAQGERFISNRLTSAGIWFGDQAWEVGTPIAPPEGAFTGRAPLIVPPEGQVPDPNAFIWNPAHGDGPRLIPVKSASEVTIRWPIDSNPIPTKFIEQRGLVKWPDNPLKYTIGTEVDLLATDENLQLAQTFLYSEGGIAPDDALLADGRFKVRSFSAHNKYAAIVFGKGGIDPNSSEFIVEPIQYIHTAQMSLLEGKCVVGQEIDPRTHEADYPYDSTTPSGSGKYIPGGANAVQAYVDVGLPESFYNFDLGVGRLFAVQEGALAVAWSKKSERTGVLWTSLPVVYDCQWPGAGHDAYKKIVIANGKGSDYSEDPILRQPPLDANARVYYQNDPDSPGYNPNNEHAFIADSATGTGKKAVFALRRPGERDLPQHDPIPRDPKPDDPKFVLVRHQGDGASVPPGFYSYEIFEREDESGTPAPVEVDVAKKLQGPYPLSAPAIGPCVDTTFAGEAQPAAFFSDRNGEVWARGEGTFGVEFYYPNSASLGFITPPNQVTENGCVRFLPSDEKGYEYQARLPEAAPVLRIGQTVTQPVNGIPAIKSQQSVEIIFDSNIDPRVEQGASLKDLCENQSALLVDLQARSVRLESLPADITNTYIDETRKIRFGDLPYALQARFFYDPVARELGFESFETQPLTGPPTVLLNVMTESDQTQAQGLSSDSAFLAAVGELYSKTRYPESACQDGAAGQKPQLGMQNVPGVGFVRRRVVGGGGALTAGASEAPGYITLALNNDKDSQSPVQLEVVKVACMPAPEGAGAGVTGGPYLGSLDALPPANIFDERMTFVHSGDFGGSPERIEFQWFFQADNTGRSPKVPESANDPTFTRLNEKGSQVILKGGLQTASDAWLYARFRGFNKADGTTPVCPTGDRDGWSDWIGAINHTRDQNVAAFSESWVKRVIKRLNLFDQRFDDFGDSEVVTYTSMVQQAGETYEGPIALNADVDNLNEIGLIETYQTLLDIGRDQSIDAAEPINYAPANNTLLFAAGRLSDLYMLLGNEAYADAIDPTIGLGTSSVEYGSMAPVLFAFQNQLPSLLDEELALLRGVDEGSDIAVFAAPVYNRLIWNFTSGDGQVAYVQAYNIDDQDANGFLAVEDAKALFPQGHGDAWGHYLSALKVYYGLLRNENFTWLPRTESVRLGNTSVHVDFLDERNFAGAAAAKAKAGAEIVDLVYRSEFTESPGGQWQGYKDVVDRDRAWGVAGWARRAGQGAYFDWVVGNAIVPPEDEADTRVGLEKIDRATVTELGAVANEYRQIEIQLTEADLGLNPLGLAKGVVPFDIDPSRLDPRFGLTHFEQVYERAEKALANATRVYDYANQLSQSLRENQDTASALATLSLDTERDLENRLVEIFGTPWTDDIGSGRTYPSGYDGPDLIHYNVVDYTEFTGLPEPPTELVDVWFTPTEGIGFYLGDDENKEAEKAAIPRAFKMNLPVEPGSGIIVGKGARQGRRRAPGEIQLRLQELIQASTAVRAARLDLRNHLENVKSAQEGLDLLIAQNAEEIAVLNGVNDSIAQIQDGIISANAIAVAAEGAERLISDAGKVVYDAIPKVIGLANDFGSVPRTLILGAVNTAAVASAMTALGKDTILAGLQKGIDAVQNSAAVRLAGIENTLARSDAEGELQALIRELPAYTLAVTEAIEVVNQTHSQYLQEIERGVRALDELKAFRRGIAAEVGDLRYQDLAFRVFRNDAIQKYRASFDLAARYAYLAATAYDYETNSLGDSNGAGRTFLTDLVKQRSLGQMIDGHPVPGSPGLGDPLGRLAANFDVLKTQLGFNNPQVETNRFSLRREFLGIRGRNEVADGRWRNRLERYRVDDLWDLPEFKRYARPFAPEAAGPQPGIVIPFQTTVTSGLNFFGQELMAGDSAYDSSQFATKVRSAGVWFTGYNRLALSNTPRVYLIPVGMDILRSRNGQNFETRQWRVVDQKIPVPFPIGTTDLSNPNWIPSADSLSEDFYGTRLFSRFRAYDDPFGVGSARDAEYSLSETTSDSRLVGRSVWNTRWLLIIPGDSLLFDAEEGLDVFVDGVEDIRLFFQTYAYSGN